MLFTFLSFQFLSTLSLRRATIKAMRGDRKALISIHALLAESDQNIRGPQARARRFLSTLSLRRATGMSWVMGDSIRYFYPRSPCGERPANRTDPSAILDFYPRSPCGERRYIWPAYLQRQIISIHALLAESDYVPVCALRVTSNFYPRSPCGERRDVIAVMTEAQSFLSTLSLRRATPFSRFFVGSRHNFYPRSPCGERPLKVLCAMAFF